ncbi:hypothetical protein V1514DRAFT_349044 [Lipomyces japonicus]|uniref:uncharacterized protein n=1 Tax=Lipomyces japonicus TaxID=56871 RepID=UPI0034CD278D
MRTSLVAQHTPLIKFIGKRVYREAIDHSPRLHPQDPHSELPSSFKEYRLRAQQYGPLSSRFSTSIQPGPGEFSSRSKLPSRYRYIRLDLDEIDSINSGGAAGF